MNFEANEGGLQEKLMTVREVANLLNVHQITIRRWEQQGQLKSYRLGAKNSIRFKREDISNFVNHTNKPQDKGGRVVG